MSVVHSWALAAGVGAIAIPIFVHFLTRPRPVTMWLSTIQFVAELVAEKRARHRMRDWLVLILRTLAIGLAAVALARPLIGPPRGVSTGNVEKPTLRVVLLDVSHSMAAEQDGVKAIERARAKAARYLADQEGVEASLILAAANPDAGGGEPTSDHSRLRAQLARASALPQRLDAQAALRGAAEVLRSHGSPSTRRECVIISDFQQTNWAAVSFSALPGNTIVQFESIAPQDPPANLAILGCVPRGRAEAGKPLRWEIEVGNYSNIPQTVAAEIRIANQRLRAEAPCDAGGRATLVVEQMFESAGWYAGEVSLLGVADSLQADNRRAIALRIDAAPKLLLVTRQSSAVRNASSYFVERALAPSVSNSVSNAGEGQNSNPTSSSLRRIDPTRDAWDSIAEGDLIIVDHPGMIEASKWDRLVDRVRLGSGLLYIAAEPIDATNLKLLASRAGRSLQMPVEFLAPNTSQSRSGLFLTDLQRRVPPFQVFGEDLAAMVDPLRFAGGLGTRRIEGTLRDDILATYNDQSAALVVTPCGAGAMAVLNVELSQSNLPASPAFVPLLGELATILLSRDQPAATIAPGETLALFLPTQIANTSGLRIVGPTSAVPGLEGWGELREVDSGVIWQSLAAGPPGVYEVRRGEETVFAVATAIPPEESDLRVMSRELLSQPSMGAQEVGYRSSMESDEMYDSAWAGLLASCVGCLIVEFIVLRTFRS